MHHGTLLIISRQRSLSYRNQFIDLLCKSMNWFLYDRHFHHESVNTKNGITYGSILLGITLLLYISVLKQQNLGLNLQIIISIVLYFVGILIQSKCSSVSLKNDITTALP